MPSLEPVLPTCIINRNFYPKQEPETQALLGIVSGLSQLLNCAWKTFGRPPQLTKAWEPCKWLCFCAWEPAQALRSFLEGMQPQSDKWQ